MFALYLLLALFGTLTTHLTAAALGSPLLPALATAALLPMLWVTRPQKAPEAVVSVSPDTCGDWPLSPELFTLNADLWVLEAYGCHTLPSEPLFGVCAVLFCEHEDKRACFCSDDCECVTHRAIRALLDTGLFV